MSKATDSQRRAWRMAYETDPDIREEFSSPENYLAYCAADAEGRIHMTRAAGPQAHRKGWDHVGQYFFSTTKVSATERVRCIAQWSKEWTENPALAKSYESRESFLSHRRAEYVGSLNLLP